MKTFWTMLANTPKATLMVPFVLLMQIMKRSGIAVPWISDANLSDAFDILSAIAGFYGLYHAMKSDPNFKTLPVTSAEKKEEVKQ